MDESTGYRVVIPVMWHTDIPFISSFADTLDSAGFSVSFAPKTENLAQTCLQKFPADSVHTGHLTEPTRDLESLVEKYDIDSPRAFVFSQLVYDYKYQRPSYDKFKLSWGDLPAYDEYLDTLHRHLSYFDRVYESGEQLIPLNNLGGEILRQVLGLVANAHDVPSVWYGFSPLPGHSGLYSRANANWTSFGEDYEDLTEDEKARATEFVDDIRSLDSNMNTGSADDESFLSTIPRKLKRIASDRLESSQIVRKWLQYNVMKPFSAMYARRQYLDEDESRRVIESDSYIFYPIQYFRESRVSLRAPAYYNQAWLVEYLSRSLPVGRELVVKDHPNQVGALPPASVRTITTFGRCLDPSYHSHEVIKNADAVVTLNNTVGFESLVLGKPVVTLGDAFYSGHGYTFDVDDINELDAVVARAAKSDGLSEEEIVEFAHGVIEGSYPGTFGYKNDENIEQLTASTIEFIDEQRSTN